MRFLPVYTLRVFGRKSVRAAQFGVRNVGVTAALALIAATVLLVSGCEPGTPDRRADVDRLTQLIAAMPGVRSATDVFNDSYAQGLVDFRVDVETSDELTGDQLVAIVSRYLGEHASGKYAGYRAELDAHNGWNVFAVDSGDRRIANTDQVLAQARDWVGLRRTFPSSTVALRATVVHPSGPPSLQEKDHSNVARLELSGASDYANAAEAVAVVASHFAELSAMDWTITAGKLHYAEITSSRRLPTPAELDVWKRLNADQHIAHLDALRINGPVKPPVWISEETTQSHDVAEAVRLATRHLPMIAAALPAPVLYTASDDLSGHIGGSGDARGPVSVSIGGCTPRDPLVYLPIAAEQSLIDRYASCRK